MEAASIVAIAGLVLIPFGSIAERVADGKPWFGFDHSGPALTLVRAQKVPVKSCPAWAQALVTVPAEEWTPVRSAASSEWRQAWEPWSESDLEPIQDCDEFPCKVKFNEAEVSEMSQAAEDKRVEKFFSLVGRRMERYSKTGERKAYEMPGGDPIDPWKSLEERGFRTALPRESKPSLFARKLNFAPDRMLTLHQILDRRSSRNVEGSEAVVWVRDAYTDHYFDGWGEGELLRCDARRSEAIVVQALFGEMDLLKKTGLFARAVFGKYRSAFEENGKTLLDARFERIRKLALKLELQAPAPPKSSAAKKSG